MLAISTELPRLQYCSDWIGGIRPRGFLAPATGYSGAVGEAVDAAAAGVESIDILGLSPRVVTTYSPAALTPSPTPTWDTGLLLTLIATRSFTWKILLIISF